MQRNKKEIKEKVKKIEKKEVGEWKKIQREEKGIQGIMWKKKEGREGKNEKQIENAGIEGRVWKIIKRQRRRGKINEKIKMGKYKKHFVRIMGEVEGKW